MFGGIAPYPWRARNTEQAMTGQPLSLVEFPRLADILAPGGRRGARALAVAHGRGARGGLHGRLPRRARGVLPLQGARQRAADGARRRGPAGYPLERRHHVGTLADLATARSTGTPASHGAPRSACRTSRSLAIYQCTGRVALHARAAGPADDGQRLVRAEPARARRSSIRRSPAAADARDGRAGRRPPARPLRPRTSTSSPTADIPPAGINKQGMGADQPLFAVDRSQLRRPVDRARPRTDRAGGDRDRRVRKRRVRRLPPLGSTRRRSTSRRGPSRCCRSSRRSRCGASSPTTRRARASSRTSGRSRGPEASSIGSRRRSRSTTGSTCATATSAASGAGSSTARSAAAAKRTSTWRRRRASRSRPTATGCSSTPRRRARWRCTRPRRWRSACSTTSSRSTSCRSAAATAARPSRHGSSRDRSSWPRTISASRCGSP